MQKFLTIHFFVQNIHKQGTYFRYHNLAIGLTGLGHKVTIFGASYDKGEKNRIEIIDGVKYDITVCSFPLKRFFGENQHPFAAIRRLMKAYPKCDISHVFQPFVSAFFPWYLNRRKAKLNVYDWDDLWTDGLINQGVSIYDKWLYAQINYLEKKGPLACGSMTVCSNYLADKAIGFGATTTEIIYNGFWKSKKRDKGNSRKIIGLRKEALYIGFMGRTTKEIGWCFELLKNATKKYPQVRLALCGMPASVLNIEESISSYIDYLGFLTPTATKDFAGAIDIGLLPLEDDPFNKSRFPIKFAEYLGAGIPVLCTNVGQCSIIARQLDFIQITETTKESWIEKGLEMIGSIAENKWPAISYVKIESVLGWPDISKRLESVYLNAGP